MKKNKRKKRAITLIEIMIVILLIGIIGGALAFNMRGSLDKGKQFTTDQRKARIHDILQLEYAKGDRTHEEILKDWETLVKESPLSNGDKAILDGWNKHFSVTFKDEEFIVSRKGEKANRNG